MEKEKIISTLKSALAEMDFSLYDWTKNVFRLKDLQGANLGNIEEDDFENVLQLVERLDRYWNDYFIESMYYSLEKSGFDTSKIPFVEDMEQYRDKMGKEYEYDFDVLYVISHPKELEKISLKDLID